jgi:hypothetical protein
MCESLYFLQDFILREIFNFLIELTKIEGYAVKLDVRVLADFKVVDAEQDILSLLGGAFEDLDVLRDHLTIVLLERFALIVIPILELKELLILGLIQQLICPIRYLQEEGFRLLEVVFQNR